MGAWGTGNFDNDDAMDWVLELESAEGVVILSKTISPVLESAESGEIDATVACRALAAAEVVAALRGKHGKNYPEDVITWVMSQEKVPVELAKFATLAVSQILESSELKELWEENEEGDAWIDVVQDLLGRLK